MGLRPFSEAGVVVTVIPSFTGFACSGVDEQARERIWEEFRWKK
jgi:hypothetical protein